MGASFGRTASATVCTPRGGASLLLVFLAGLAAAEDPLPAGALARIGPSPFRHHADVSAVAVSPDGRLVVSSCQGGEVCLWDASSGAPIWTTPRAPAPVLALAMNAAGTSIASGAKDGSVRLWDPATGKVSLTLRETGEPVPSVAFHPSQPILVSASDSGVVSVWDTDKGERIRTFGERGDKIATLAVSPDGMSVLIGGHAGAVRLVELSSGKVTRAYEGPSAAVLAVSFSPRGDSVGAACVSGQCFRWELDSGRQLFAIEAEARGLHAASMSPDGSLYAAQGLDATVMLWDFVTGKLLARTGPLSAGPGPMAFSADGSTLVFGRGQAIRLWRAKSDREPLLEEGRQLPITALAATRDGAVLAIADRDELALWDGSTGRRSRVLDRPDGGTASLAFSFDDRCLIAAGDDGALHVWDRSTGHALATLDGHKGGVMSVAASPIGDVLATVGRDGIFLWSLESGRPRPVEQTTKPVCGLALSADGALLYGGIESTVIQVWDTATGKRVREITVPHARGGFDVSPSGRLLASGVSGGVVLTEATTGKSALSLDIDGGPGVSLFPVWTPDGRRIAAACVDGRVRVWDAVSGRTIRRFEAGCGRDSRVVVSRDGRRLVSTSPDGSVLVWDMTQGPDPAVFGEDAFASWSAADEDGRLLRHDVVARLGSARFRHARIVTDFSPSADGKRIASVDTSGRLCVWDVASGRLTSPVLETTARLACFTADGRGVICRDNDGSWHVVDAVTGKSVRPIAKDGATNHTQEYLPCALSPDGSLLASGSLLLQEGKSDRFLRSTTPTPAHCVAFSPDGGRIAMLHEDGVIHVWDATLPGRELESPAAVAFGAEGSLAFSPDGKLLAFGTSLKEICLWNLSESKESRLITGHEGAIVSVDFSSDGLTIASTSLDGTLRTWAVEDGRAGACHRLPVSSNGKVLFLPGGTSVAVALGASLLVWDLRSEPPIPLTASPVTAVDISPDSRQVALGREDGDVQIGNVETGRIVRSVGRLRKSVLAVAWVNEGRRVFAISGNGAFVLSDVDGGATVRVGDLGRPGVSSAWASPGGCWIGASFDGHSGTRVWKVPEGEDLGNAVAQLVEASGPLAFSTDGRAAWGFGGTVILCDTSTWAKSRLAPPTSVSRVFFDRSGRLMGVHREVETDRVIDVATGEIVLEAKSGERNHPPLAASRSGLLLAWGLGDDELTLTGPLPGAGSRVLEGERLGRMRCCAFSRDEDLIVAGAYDGRAIVWAIRPRVHVVGGAEETPLLWEALAMMDPADGYAAVASLVHAPSSVLDEVGRGLEAEPASSGDGLSPRTLRRLRIAQAAEWKSGDDALRLLERLASTARSDEEASDAKGAIARAKADKGR